MLLDEEIERQVKAECEAEVRKLATFSLVLSMLGHSIVLFQLYDFDWTTSLCGTCAVFCFAAALYRSKVRTRQFPVAKIHRDRIHQRN